MTQWRLNTKEGPLNVRTRSLLYSHRGIYCTSTQAFFFPSPLICHLNFYRAPDLCRFSSRRTRSRLSDTGSFFPSKLKNEPFYIHARVLQQRLTHLCRQFSLTQTVRRHQRLRSRYGHHFTMLRSHTHKTHFGVFHWRVSAFFSPQKDFFHLSRSSSTKFSPFGSYYWWK